MNFPDPKKLAAGFLFLAVIAVSAGQIFFARPLAPSSAEAPPAPVAGEPGPERAFVERPATGDAERTIAEKLIAPSADTDAAGRENLTDRLARTFAEQWANQSPEEIFSDQFGGDTAAFQNAIVTLVNDPGTAAKSGAAPQDIPEPKTIDPYAPEDVVRYAKAVKEIIDARFGSVAPPVRDMNAWAKKARDIALGNAAEEVGALEVPLPLAPVHRALLRSFAELRTFLAYDYQAESAEDPLKAIVRMEAHARFARAAFADLERAITLATPRTPRSSGNGFRDALYSAFRAIFGINETHALISQPPVPTDCRGMAVCLPMFLAMGTTTLFTWLHLGTAWLEYSRLLGLQNVKDRLIHRLVRETIGWIQGGGKPQFITNWKGFLGNAANDALGLFTQDVQRQLCSSFGISVIAAISPVNPALDRPAACTLGQVVRNIRLFADNFNRGGWIAYGAALQPQNNFFGALIQTKGIFDREAYAEKKAGELEGQANKQYRSTKLCAKETTAFALCRDACAQQAAQDPTTLCSCDLALQNEKVCLEWRTTTPGQVLGEMVGDALSGSPVHRIVNAEDAAKLVAAFANYLINIALSKLMNLGNKAVNPGLMGVQPYMPSCSYDTSMCSALPSDFRQSCIQDILSMTCPGSTPTPSSGPGCAAGQTAGPATLTVQCSTSGNILTWTTTSCYLFNYLFKVVPSCTNVGGDCQNGTRTQLVTENSNTGYYTFMYVDQTTSSVSYYHKSGPPNTLASNIVTCSPTTP